MENDFFSPFTKIKNKKKRQKLIKNKFFLQNFFVFFGSLKTTDIFIPSMKFSLNYQQQNFIYAFFKKMTVKYLFE